MKILNLETGQTFKSIAEAARAAGTDASNIGKVLRGKRKQAGGFRFQWVPDIPPEQVYKNALSSAQAAIRAANLAIKEYKRENVYSIGKAVGELLELGDIIGTTSRGYLRQSRQGLKEAFPGIEDLPDIQQITRQLEKLTQKAWDQLDKAIQEKTDLADQFGISVNQMNEYMNLMPEIFDILYIAGTDPRVGSNEVYETFKDAMQNYVSRKDLRNLMERVTRWFGNPNRKDDFSEVYRKWADRTIEKSGGKEYYFNV